MSVLKLKCLDQVMNIVSLPTIASGGVEENTLEVEFCQQWDGFAKVAAFYKKEGKNITNVSFKVLQDNKCVFPNDITKTEGKIVIGIFGVKDSVTRTSNLIEFKVVQGAIVEGFEVEEPDPTIYEQLLAIQSVISEQYEEVSKEYESILHSVQSIVNEMVLRGVINQADTTELLKLWLGTNGEYGSVTEPTESTIYFVDEEYSPFTIIEVLIDENNKPSTSFRLSQLAGDNLASYVVKLIDANGNYHYLDHKSYEASTNVFIDEYNEEIEVTTYEFHFFNDNHKITIIYDDYDNRPGTINYHFNFVYKSSYSYRSGISEQTDAINVNSKLNTTIHISGDTAICDVPANCMGFLRMSFAGQLRVVPFYLISGVGSTAMVLVNGPDGAVVAEMKYACVSYYRNSLGELVVSIDTAKSTYNLSDSQYVSVADVICFEINRG